MAESDFVTVPISLTKQPLTRAGFGTPLIMGADCPAGFTQRSRTYNTPADLLTDGFDAQGPTYLMSQVLMEQDQAPTSFKVGRLVNKPTQAFSLVFVAADNTEYAGTFNGVRWTFTSGTSATTTTITTGVRAAVAALISAQSRTIVPSGTTSAVYTQATPGLLDSLSVENVDLITLTQTHADPGAAADLAAINVYDSDFYGILNPFDSKLMGLAIAGWAETQGGVKQYFANTCDSSHANVAVGSATDLATTIQTDAYNYSCVLYSPAASDFLGAALCGLLLPQDPGSENWAMQAPTIAAAKLTATHRANLVAKYCTFCEVLGGQNNTFEGKVGSGQYIDTIRFRAWLQVNIQADVITAVKAQAPKKLPMSDAGAHVIQTAIQGVLNRGVKVGGLLSDPAPAVVVPLVANIPSIDRQNRIMSGITFSAQLAGAINGTGTIKGQLTA